MPVGLFVVLKVFYEKEVAFEVYSSIHEFVNLFQDKIVKRVFPSFAHGAILVIFLTWAECHVYTFEVC